MYIIFIHTYAYRYRPYIDRLIDRYTYDYNTNTHDNKAAGAGTWIMLSVYSLTTVFNRTKITFYTFLK